VRPKVLVALGATAAQSLLGRQFRVTKQRGTPVESELAPYVVATVHPSSILRQETEEDRAAAMKDFVADLKVVAKLLRS
jgi:DNA polymerase